MKTLLCTAGFLFAISAIADAQLALPAVFSDNMVLQQQCDASVWGCGFPNQKIKIVGSWAPQDTTVASVKETGRWQTTLKTTQACGPYSLTVIGDKVITLQNVMLGEVWLCSGQSNMEWKAAFGLINQQEEMGEANCNNYQTYGLLMKTLIESWRADFGAEMPFYFVQIAPFRYQSKQNGPALLREQQEFVSKLVPHTGIE